MTLNGTQIADSYKKLRKMLNANDLYKNSFLMGPSTAGLPTDLINE